MKKFLLLSILLFTLFKSHSQDYFKPVDSIVKLYNDKKIPGFAVSVAQNGKELYSNQTGYANLEDDKKIKKNTVFSLASSSKQFTAACIVLLHQQGKLSLNDNLRKHIPEFPEYAEKITLINLLNHTSGIKDYRILANLRGYKSDNLTNQEVKEMLTGLELNFEPGTQWNYSNSGYWCLVQIVEKISGQTIADFAKENIFSPLKMKHTKYAILPDFKVKRKAISYQSNENGYTPTQTDAYAIAGSGVYSTTEDLQKWLHEMSTQRHFGKDFWDIMLTDNPAKHNGFEYTKGLFTYPYRKLTMINHGGDLDGIHTLTAYFPEKKTSIVILSNDDDFKRGRVLSASVDRLLGLHYKYPEPEALKEEKPEEETVEISADKLEVYTGTYQLEEGYNILISIENGKLFMTQLWDGTAAVLEAVKTTDNFIIKDAGVTFTFSNSVNNKPNSLVVVTQEEQNTFIRTEKIPDTTAYDKYSGTYFCYELKTSVTFFTEKGVLRYKIAQNEKSRIASPPEENGSFATHYGEFTFKSDESGNITSVILNHERAKNLEYVKQKSE